MSSLKRCFFPSQVSSWKNSNLSPSQRLGSSTLLNTNFISHQKHFDLIATCKFINFTLRILEKSRDYYHISLPHLLKRKESFSCSEVRSKVVLSYRTLQTVQSISSWQRPTTRSTDAYYLTMRARNDRMKSTILDPLQQTLCRRCSIKASVQ